MNSYIVYAVVLVLLFLIERIYFRLAEHFNIVDMPNGRSSHSTVVLRGGGIIFLIALLVWFAFFGFRYPLFVLAVLIAAGISFADDIKSLPVLVRLVVQFAAMGLMIAQLYILGRTEEGLFWDCNPLTDFGA